MLKVFYFKTSKGRKVSCALEDSKPLWNNNLCFLEDMDKVEIVEFQNKLKSILHFLIETKLEVIEFRDLIKLFNIKSCNFRKVKLKGLK